MILLNTLCNLFIGNWLSIQWLVDDNCNQLIGLHKQVLCSSILDQQWGCLSLDVSLMYHLFNAPFSLFTANSKNQFTFRTWLYINQFPFRLKGGNLLKIQIIQIVPIVLLQTCTLPMSIDWLESHAADLQTLSSNHPFSFWREQMQFSIALQLRT